MEAAPIKLLLVEDDADDRLLIADMLEECDAARFAINCAGSIEEARRLAADDRPDAVLLDLGLPDSLGLPTFQGLHAACEGVPIVVLTGLDDQTVGLQAVHAGAQDYLVKGQVDAPLLARSVRYAIERQRLERELKRAVEDLDREFQTVAELQAGFLPAGPPDVPGFEVNTHYRPARRAGGDYFDFLALPGGCCGVLIADVSGHGAPAAVVMAMVRLLVHTAGTLTPPQDVLAGLNAALVDNIPRREFVTACYGVLDPAAGRFDYALAGHSPPVAFGPGGQRVPAADGTGPALGLSAGATCPAHSLDIADGGGLVLYTDGVSECRNAADEEFGEAGIARAVARAGASSAAGIGDALIAALGEHRAGRAFDDDITFIVLLARR